MADFTSTDHGAGTRKVKQVFSLEQLIGKLKTTPASSHNDSAVELAAEGSVNGHPVPEKKSRRKGIPISYVAAASERETSLSEMPPDVEEDGSMETDKPLSTSSCKVESLPSNKAPKAPSPAKCSAQNTQDEIPEGTIVVNPEAPSLEEESNAPKIAPEMAGSELAKGAATEVTAKATDTFHCTVCKEALYVKEPHTIKQHPNLRVIVCKSCFSFYSSGEFTQDEDGYDNQCTWCGEGGNLLICDFCPKAFCKRCIRNNFKRDMLKNIESCSEWRCLVCDPKPLASHVLKSTQLQKLISDIDERLKEKQAKVLASREMRRGIGKVTQQTSRPYPVLTSHQVVSRPAIRPKPSIASAMSAPWAIASVPQANSAAAILTHVAAKVSPANVGKNTATASPRGGVSSASSRVVTPIAPKVVTSIAHKNVVTSIASKSVMKPIAPKGVTTLTTSKGMPTSTASKVVPSLTAGKGASGPAPVNDSRVYIHVPARTNFRSNEKALLSVNLSTIANQYITAQKVRCDQIFLENLVREHNNFSSSLKQAKEILLVAHDRYKTMVASAKDYQRKMAARDAYKETCEKLGESMRSRISQNINNLIRLVSSTSESKTTTSKRARVSVDVPLVSDAPAATSTQPSVSTPLVSDAPVSISTQPSVSTLTTPQTSTPQVSLKPRAAATPSAAPKASPAPVLSARSPKPLDKERNQPQSSKQVENREFIDINELKKTDRPQHIINLCSEDEEDDSTSSAPAQENKVEPQEVIPHVNNESSTVPVDHAEDFDVGRQPFSPGNEPSDINSDGVERTTVVRNQLDFSTATVSQTPVITPEVEILAQEADPKETQAHSPLICNTEGELALSSDDDLVGVTPRRLSSKTGKGDGNNSTAVRRSTRSSGPVKDMTKELESQAEVSDSSPIKDDLDHSGELVESDKQPQPEVHEAEKETSTGEAPPLGEQAATGCDPKAGPSGITRRALRRLIKEQENEQAHNSKKPPQAHERGQKSHLSKEFISSSDEESSDGKTSKPSSPPAASVERPSTPACDMNLDGNDSDTSNAGLDSNLVTKTVVSPAVSDDEAHKQPDTGSISPSNKEQSTALAHRDSASGSDMDNPDLVTIDGCKKRHRSDDSESDHHSPNQPTAKRVTRRARGDGMPGKLAKRQVRKRMRGENDSVSHADSDDNKSDNNQKLSGAVSKDESLSEEEDTSNHKLEGVSDLSKEDSSNEQHKRDASSSKEDAKDASESRSSDGDSSFSGKVSSRTRKRSERNKSALPSGDHESPSHNRRRTKRGSPKKQTLAKKVTVENPKLSPDIAGDVSAAEDAFHHSAAESAREDALLGASLSDDDLLDTVPSGGEEVNDALLADSESEVGGGGTPVGDHMNTKAKDESDATLTDAVENTKAMHELKDALLSSSDIESDPPPRVILRRRAKQVHDKKPSRAKPRTAAEKRERSFMKLKPEQRRFMRKRANGLRINLMEKRQSALQKLLLEIESKSVTEMDTDNKLSCKSQVVLTRMDLTDDVVVKKLVAANESNNKFKWAEAPLEPDSAADSDLEKEIERLAKFTAMLKSAGSEPKKYGPNQRRRRAKKHQKKKVCVMESDDSLSDITSAQSEQETDVDTSGSDSDGQKSDIIVIPNKDQVANEEAMKSLLQLMADSESEGNSLSSVNSSDSDTEKEAKKLAARKKSKRKTRKLHPLEQEGIGEKDGRREVGSSGSSSSEFDDDDLDSSDSEVIPRGRKRRFCVSGSDTDNTIDKKLSSRDNRRSKKGKRKRVVRMSSNSSSEDDAASSSDSDIEEMTPSKGRHKIRKVLDDDKLKATTKSAHKLEMERRKRIEEMQKKYNDELMAKEGPKAMKSHRELVLERSEKGKAIVEVDPNLVKKLKPHQIDAVRFMWECVCETVERSNKGGGGGCILAHCMGLGKTLSLITFLHTLLSHEDKLSLRKMLVIAPLNTVLNWKDEVEKWTSNLEIDVDVDELQSCKKNVDRLYRLKRWHSTGGIMIVGYDLFRNLSLGTTVKKGELKERFQQYLIKPGADVVVCDEGHLLKNAKSGMRKSVMATETKRRIVLTGTPLQNNLKEYHCMVDFVKPSLLGTASEFNNRFVHPITNGQYEDSTPFDVKLMKKRAHVLHEMLAGCVQRRDYSELTKFLPPKHEYILSVKLTELQVKLYQFYIDKIKGDGKLGIKGKLFSDFQNLSRVWSHPMALELHKQRKEEERDFIDDETSETPSESSDDGSDILVKNSDDENDTWRPNRKKKTTVDELKGESGQVRSGASTPVNDHLWWKDEVKDVKMNDISLGYKFVLLLEILKKCEEIGDKVLLFSQGILTLDLIEDFLEIIHNSADEVTKALYGRVEWKKGVNYFRIDGGVDAAQRRRACSLFNKTTNHNARLFLISTRAGGMGINLVGANRVIIFDASWNPSFDVQAIFRAYRFGQTKPVYVYRFLAQATMEERIYERQIAKLSLSERVVDEKQIHRHFTANDLTELYNFKPDTEESNEIHALPKDRLLADLLDTHGHLIRNVREHDSLLENKEEEKLSEEERKAAWQEYQQEKERVNLPPAPPPSFSVPSAPGFSAPAFLPSNVFDSVLLNDMEKQRLKETLQRRFPSTTGEHLKKMLERQCNEINSKRIKAYQSHQVQLRAAGSANQEQGMFTQQPMGDDRILQQHYLLQQRYRQQQFQQQQLQQQQIQQQIGKSQRDFSFAAKK